MKPKQYPLIGFPYSGKTTLAEELEKRLGYAHINIDQLKFVSIGLTKNLKIYEKSDC